MPATGERLKTVITKETIAVPERTTPDFWTYCQDLTAQQWENHYIYLYRVIENLTPMLHLEKIYNGQFEVIPGKYVHFNNREDVEWGIKEKWGGKMFRLILKDRNQRISEARVYNDAPAKTQPGTSQSSSFQNATGPSVMPAGSSDAAEIAKTAIGTIAQQDRSTMDVAVTAIRGAADVVQRMAATPANNTNDKIIEILLARALDRGDPIDLLAKLAGVMQTLHPPAQPGNGAGSGSPLLERFLESIMPVAVDRLLNPPSMAGAATNAAAELVKQLPAVAGYVSQAFAEWRTGMQAQRDTANIMASGRPIAAAQPAPAPQPKTLMAAPAPAPNPAESSSTPIPLEFIESKIVEILRENTSAEDAADDALSFLDRMDPQLIVQLIGLGETGLVGLFHSRPTLRQATANTARLVEFVRAFVRIAAEVQQMKKEAQENAGKTISAQASAPS